MRRLPLTAACAIAAITLGCPRKATTPANRPSAPASRFAAEPAPAKIRTTSETIVFHPVRLDERDQILPAIASEAPFADVARLGFRAFAAIPDAPNGKKPYFFSSMFKPHDGVTFNPHTWLHNPTGLSAMLVRSGLRWYAWSGDRAPIDAARALVDHVIAHGLTDAKADWSAVPYSSANAGDLEYGGGDDVQYCDDHVACGRGDGRGFLEPDKIGEFAGALLMLHRFTGEPSYLDVAIRCADALAKHVSEGDAEHSPWPFRVDAASGKVVREAYGTNWIWTVAFFDALATMGKASDAHLRARNLAWEWLRKYPLVTQQWQGFFEDIPIYEKPGTNPNQYSAGETARWLLAHPDRDPDAITHARAILAWVAKTFAVDVDSPIGPTPGTWHGAEVISEQAADMAKMGSHTARYASVLARLYEVTGEAELRARALRSFAWATYCIDDRGVVKVGPDDREGYWFSDGYGDYLVHFLDGMAAVPAWAPSKEAHVLRTDDVLVDVAYAEGSLRYRGSAAGTEEIRVPAAPKKITLAGAELSPKSYETTTMPNGGAVIVLKRASGGDVAVTW